ncbi:TPA: LexA family transcriptional regulator [Campylobacter jejuni]|nr:LexA family transcriptional regulator [Campylobacter jejuni]
MNLAQKIRALRENKGWTQTELAQYSGIGKSTIQLYESNNAKKNPTIENLKKIADAFEVSIDYFNDNLSISKNNKMSISGKNLSINSNKVSINQTNLKVENSAQTLNDDMINIPFFENVRASAGSGAYNDEESTQALGLSKSFLRECFGLYSFINLSVILGQGDSMTPTLPENCYLLIQQGEVAEGEICVTRIEDELYVKRLQKRPKLKLLSDNKAYEPINLEGENFEILGRVVGYFKKTTL